MELLVRNKVADYGRWRRLFDEQGEAARAAGLSLRQLWRSVDDPNDVFFLFEVEDRGRAEAFMHAPEAAAVGQAAGVVDGEYNFLNTEGVH